MAKVESNDRLFDEGISGNFGRPWEFSQKRFGEGEMGEEEKVILKEKNGPKPRWGIYQKRYSHWHMVNGKRKYYGKCFYIRESFMTHDQHATAPRLAGWQNFRNGMTAWGGLTSQQKQAYNKRGDRLQLHGVNLFLREWLKSH
jgi:hypothetical protein